MSASPARSFPVRAALPRFCSSCGGALGPDYRCSGCGGSWRKGSADLPAQVLAALSDNGPATTAALAALLGVQRFRIVEAFDAIEAAGIKLHRAPGLDGGAEIDEAAEVPLPRAGMRGRHVGNGLLFKRVRRVA